MFCHDSNQYRGSQFTGHCKCGRTRYLWCWRRRRIGSWCNTAQRRNSHSIASGTWTSCSGSASKPCRSMRKPLACRVYRLRELAAIVSRSAHSSHSCRYQASAHVIMLLAVLWRRALPAVGPSSGVSGGTTLRSEPLAPAGHEDAGESFALNQKGFLDRNMDTDPAANWTALSDGEHGGVRSRV